jgi:hypothetical protein
MTLAQAADGMPKISKIETGSGAGQCKLNSIILTFGQSHYLLFINFGKIVLIIAIVEGMQRTIFRYEIVVNHGQRTLPLPNMASRAQPPQG